MFLKRLSSLTLFAALLLAACAPTAAPSTTDPAAVVRAYYNGINTNEIEQAMRFAADEIVISDPSGVIAGKPAVMAYWQELATAGFKFELSDLQATGGRVTSCYKVSQNDTPLDEGCNGVTHVQDGKIVFDGLVPAEAAFVVEHYYAALNAHDIDGAMAYVAPSAVFANPTGQYTTAAEIRASLEGLAKDGITFALSNYRGSDGRVVYDYQVLLAGETLETGTDGLTIVKDGLIVFDGTERTEQ